jgi:hypothetical protein
MDALQGMEGDDFMKRIVLLAVMAAFAVYASAASASPGATGAHRLSATKTEWTAEYNASAYYGEVKCKGKTIVSKKYPGGKEVEKCEAVSGTLAHMKAGKEQHAFENTEGGFVGEWESDSGSGLRTTNYTYSVNNKVTKFKIIAIYAAPEEA